jgi:hypothetical protein
MVAAPSRFGRWFIEHRTEPTLAWTGAQWTGHDRGIPTFDVQVCNFSSKSGAQQYIDEAAAYEARLESALHFSLPTENSELRTENSAPEAKA